VQVGPFFVIQYQCVHSKANAIQHHQCSTDSKHFLIESSVKHDFVAEPQRHTKENLHDLLDNILFKSGKLTHFMQQQRFLAQDDPFAPIIERFLNEEDQIYHTVPIDYSMNRGVREVLSSIKEIRGKNRIQLNESNEKHSLDEICRIIDELKFYKTVKKQIDSIMESRQIKMKASEYRVETNFLKNKIFTKFTNSFQ
jgi:hypothetical protein